MSKRFKTAPVPTGEVARYTSDPYNLSSIYMFGSSSPFTGQGNTIVRPNDDLLLAKGGNRALVVYQRLLQDEQVQGCFSKLMQEVTSRPWYVQEYSDKPGDLAVRDFVAEVLAEMPLDDIYKGMAESMIAGFSVGEVMWKKTKRGVIPFDVRMRDQRRFVFQESEDAEIGFTMRCLTYNRMFEGVELPQRKFILSRYYVQHNGDPYGSALGRILYPLVKFRRRAIESYVLFGDRYATPTAVAKAPLSASTRELDTLYGHLSNLSQETAMILPEGYELEFVVPSGSPEIFKNLIDYVDKEISLVVCGEDEAGRAEAGSRASSQVANTIRVVRASEISEMLSHTLTQSLVRWIVDLNFGTDVAAPSLTREFRIEESSVTVPDLSLLIQSGFTPRKEWIERHFRVELEEKKEGEDENVPTQYDPQQDQDLFGSIFGGEKGQPVQQQEQGAEQDLDDAAAVMDEPSGATPEESQADAIDDSESIDYDALVNSLLEEEPETSMFEDEEEGELEEGEEEKTTKKPFGDEIITEDEAVAMSRKEG
jgi:phage gp29-like protein